MFRVTRLRFYLLAVAVVLVLVFLGSYIQYEARSWRLSAPLGRASYAYYMFGAIFLFVADMVLIVFIFELLHKQW